MSCARTRPGEVPSVAFQGPSWIHRLGTGESSRGEARAALHRDTGILVVTQFFKVSHYRNSG
jgi:hypothetical protein